MTSSVSSMDISDSFRPEDLSKTDFFDFVSPPQQDISETTKNNSITVMGKGNEQPLQGFDQFWGAEKETQHRLESAIFEDLNRYCWNQQNATNISVSSAAANSSSNPQVLNNGDGQQIYTITVLNSSSTDQWLRKDISSTSAQSNGLDVNLDTILSNYPYVKTEYFSYDDSGFGTAESTKEDINYQHPPTHQLLQPQSAGVTTTSALLENSLSAASDLISYTEMNNNNNNNEWSEDRNENKDWETCEANESPESLLRSALLQGKSYAKTANLQAPTLKLTKDEDMLRRTLFTEDQETLTFANENPQSTLSQHVSTIIDDMFLTLDTTFTDEFEKMKRITNEVQQFCAIDVQENSYGEVISINNSDNSESQNLTTNDITNSSLINNTGKINKSRCNGIKTTKKYKKTLTNNNNTNMNNLNNNNDTSTINNNLSSKNAMINLTSMSNNNSVSVSASQSNGLGSSSATCNGIRKERSLHYCSICSKGFKDKYSVNVHIRTHTGEKPFACSLCGKSFRQKAHLAKHYQTHLQKKQHQKHSLANSQPITQATI